MAITTAQTSSSTDPLRLMPGTPAVQQTDERTTLRLKNRARNSTRSR
jgi:hypothetical protein